MALEFGDENKPNPMPMRTRTATMYQIAVYPLSGTRRKMPIAVSDMPVDTTKRGSILSESLPANGEITACDIACESIMMPAICGVKALMYCRYSLIKLLFAGFKANVLKESGYYILVFF